MATEYGDGGPAFPQDMSPEQRWYGGLTRRDWFAGQALAGLALRYGMPVSKSLRWYQDMAGEAYRIADAMLAEANR